MNNEQQQIIDEAYDNYKTIHKHAISTEGNRSQLAIESLEKQLIYPQEEFISKIKTNPEFSQKWGLKIEERELSLEERYKLDHHFDCLIGEYPEHQITLDKRGVPRKLITITYNNETIESYEQTR